MQKVVRFPRKDIKGLILPLRIGGSASGGSRRPKLLGDCSKRPSRHHQTLAVPVVIAGDGGGGRPRWMMLRYQRRH